MNVSGVTYTSSSGRHSPYHDLINALDSGASVEVYNVTAAPVSGSLARSYDPETQAVVDYLGGKVPQRGSRTVELVSRFIF